MSILRFRGFRKLCQYVYNSCRNLPPFGIQRVPEALYSPASTSICLYYVSEASESSANTSTTLVETFLLSAFNAFQRLCIALPVRLYVYTTFQRLRIALPVRHSPSPAFTARSRGSCNSASTS